MGVFNVRRCKSLQSPSTPRPKGLKVNNLTPRQPRVRPHIPSNYTEHDFEKGRKFFEKYIRGELGTPSPHKVRMEESMRHESDGEESTQHESDGEESTQHESDGEESTQHESDGKRSPKRAKTETPTQHYNGGKITRKKSKRKNKSKKSNSRKKNRRTVRKR